LHAPPTVAVGAPVATVSFEKHRGTGAAFC